MCNQLTMPGSAMRKKMLLHDTQRPAYLAVLPHVCGCESQSPGLLIISCTWYIQVGGTVGRLQPVVAGRGGGGGGNGYITGV